MSEKFVTLEQAQTFLDEKFAVNADDVTLVGEGAWSRCFGFRKTGNDIDDDLVIRFGKYVDDFENDKRAYQYATPTLPIPKVLEIGAAFDGYYAISTRVYGEPLESVHTEQWRTIVPSLVAAMETMRTVDLSHSKGIGGWGRDGNAPCATWSEHVLGVDNDTPSHRTYGWRNKMRMYSPAGEEAFIWGYRRLEEFVRDDIPRSLLHNDLINRNALVEGDKLSGIFDWGCSIYGDHLYELAWFEFWEPWMTNLDVPYLRAELEQQWQSVGYRPENQEQRLKVCYLHIGLDHLAYNSYIDDWETLLMTAEQMKRLCE
ncbi:MAG: phosphotransferase [Chloroflexota bacterium]